MEGTLAGVSHHPTVSKAASSRQQNYIGMDAGRDYCGNTDYHGNLYFWLAEVYRYPVSVRTNMGLVTRVDSALLIRIFPVMPACSSYSWNMIQHLFDIHVNQMANKLPLLPRVPYEL